MKGKIVSILVLMSVLCSFSLSAQQRGAKVTINSDNRTLMDCIRSIEKQTGYSFIFNSTLAVDQNVSVSLRDASLENALASVFGANGIEYEIKDSQIVLKGSEVSTYKTISGIVVDNQKMPIPGAAVLENSKNGVASDLDGNFTITVPSNVTRLRVSCLGYMEKTVSFAKNADNITVVLDEDLLSLNESVVVGYGTQKKVNLTGAIATVSSETIENRTAPTLTHMLQGSVPGLNITTSSGRPGNSASINIRGVNSINGGNPLVLVDGAEGDLAKLNPNDVESISVIKDASSAAIYGARASAGVILVTTKQGSDSEGKATVRYSGRLGWNTPTVSTDYETRGYYSVYLNDLFYKNRTGANYSLYTAEDMEELWNRRNDVVENPERPWVKIDQRDGRNTYVYYANTDWYHYLYSDTTPLQSHNISLSGGSKHVKYYISGGYDNQEGIFRMNPDKMNKFNFRSKLTFDINKYMKLSNNTSYYSNSYTYPGPSGVNTSFSLMTVHALASYPTQNPDGSSIWQTAFSTNGNVMDGLLTILDKGKHVNKDVNDRFSTTTELTITPFKGLDIVANFTYALNVQRNMNRYVNTTYSKYPGEILVANTGRMDNYLQETNSAHHYYQANLFATYEKSFRESHNLKVMAGFNYETKKLKDVKSVGYNLMSDNLSDLNLVGQGTDGNKRMEVSGGYNDYALEGAFGRLNYDYKGRYLFEASARFDGSSRFAPGHRWGFFPSASAGWRISEEEFFEPYKDWFNNLKIRYSYGRLGNQQVGYYDYVRKITIGTQSYLFGGSKPTTASISAPVASDLTWEISEQNNIGLDMAFLNNRLGFTGEAYVRDTKNMLTAGIALPATYGASSPKMNSADMRTKGYELQLSWRDGFELLGDTFNYSVTASFSDYKSVITKFDNPDKSFAKNYYEGMVWGEIWGYEVNGFFKTDEEAKAYMDNIEGLNTIYGMTLSSAIPELKAGDVKFEDIDGDGKMSLGKNTVDDPGDRKIIGNSQPRYQYGLNLSFNWHGFDFSVFFQGVGKADWYPKGNTMLFWGPFARSYATLIPRDFHTMYWTEENPDAYFPRPRGYIALNSGCLTRPNTKYLQNVGYCRLKNLTVGYSLPKKWMDAIGFKGVRLYFSGENLAFLSGIESNYIDPEMAMISDTELRVYPWQKTIMFGLDVTF